MKASRLVIFATTAATLAFAAPPAHAQQLEPAVHFGASAGLNIPLSDLSRAVQTGYIINGFAQGTPEGSPVALRGEIAYSGFSGKNSLVNQNVTMLMVNAVLPTAATGDVPYFIGGVGLNHVSSYIGVNSENDLGLNFGGGYEWQLGDMHYFVEMRYYYIAHTGASRQMLPITFGVTF
ncbi:MAG TPA: hypothetical protein VNF92_04575 [Gemmatimonadaceae bacterium]|nr:hypothetical protein [Gemmatimonadaceae bacterium]